MTAPVSCAAGASSNSVCMRAIRYTPAVTIVAAWISAETGVGPSIASGSQVCSGICADLAAAPTSSSRQPAVMSASPEWKTCGAAANTFVNSKRAGVLEDEVGAEHQPHVADDVDHERLDPRSRGGGAPVPEGDQQVGGSADERPADDQQQEVAGEHQQQHREDEEVEVGEVAREAAVLLQVGDRVEVDHRGDPGDDQDHVDRQRVDKDRDVRVDPDRHCVAPQRGVQLAVGGGMALQLDQRSERGEESKADRGSADPPGGPVWQHAEAEADNERPEQREQQHQPAERRRAHPWSSRISSTSIGSRRR